MKRKLTMFLFKNITIIFILCFAITLLCGCGQQEININVDGIEISKKNIYMAEGQTAVISAQVYPFNATNQSYEFESSDENVVTIEDGFVVAKNAGDAVIYVYSLDGGYRDSCNVLVTRASNNLALNDYNNLNMPPKELEPIYNSDDYVENTKQTQYKTEKTAKNTTKDIKNNKNTQNVNKSAPKSKSKRYTVKNMTNNKSNSNNLTKQTKKPIYNKKTNKISNKSFKNTAKEIAQKVNAEVSDDVEAGKNVLRDIKAELQNSINSLQQEKEIIANSVTSFAEDSFLNSFNNIQCEMLDIFKNIKQDMLNSLSVAEQKLEDEEYTVESKNINGVTFVVIKNNLDTSNNQTENI